MGQIVSANNSCYKKHSEVRLSLENYEKQLLLKSIKFRTLELSYKREIQSLKDEAEKNSKERDNLQEEISALKSSIIKKIADKSKELKKTSNERDSLLVKISSLKSKIKKKIADKNQKAKKISNERDSLMIELSSLKFAFYYEITKKSQEVDKISHERDNLLADISTLKSTIVKETTEENEELKSEVQYWKTRVHVPKLVKYLEHSTSVSLAKYFNQWKEEKSTDTVEVVNSIKMYQDSCLKTLQKNPLLSIFSRGSLHALSPSEAYKKAEEILDKKYESDCAYMLNGRTPKSIPEFTIEHFKKFKGSGAIESINELLATMQQLYEKGDDYGTLLCRIFQVSHPEPVPTSLTVFLTHARAEFYRTAKRRSDSKISLSEGINLIFSLFPTDKMCREISIQQLKPEEMGVADFVLFRVCHKLGKLRILPEILFNRIDTNKSKSVQRELLIEGLNSILEVAIQPREAKCLFRKIDQDNSGYITAEAFFSFTNLNMHRKLVGKYFICLSKLLTALIETNKIIVINNKALLRSLTKKLPFKVQQSHAEEVLVKACSDFADSIECPIDREKFIETLVKNRRSSFNRSTTTVSLIYSLDKN